MSASCCSPSSPERARPPSARYRRVLWVALAVNAAMFAVELIAAGAADSLALLADAVDFLGDAMNYAVSLLALAAAPIWRSRVALGKGVAMGGFGLWVLGGAVWSALAGSAPEPAVMGAVGLAALVANVSVAALLYAFRDGDANMRSVWLCSRNDAIGNVAVMLAALGVFGTGSAWPDLAVAALMGVLALRAAVDVIGRARAELRAPAARPTVERAAVHSHAPAEERT